MNVLLDRLKAVEEEIEDIQSSLPQPRHYPEYISISHLLRIIENNLFDIIRNIESKL